MDNDEHPPSLNIKDLPTSNLKALEQRCQEIILNAPKNTKELTSADLAKFLFSLSINYCKKKRYKLGAKIRKLIDKLNIEISSEQYLINSYDFLNYYSCALKDSGHLHKAKAIALKAIDLANACPILNKSECYMNMCVILSSSNSHKKALEYAKLALESIKKEVEQAKNTNNKEKLTEKYIKISIANYNLAAEEEFFKNIYSSSHYYENSLMILEKNKITKPELEEKIKQGLSRMKKLKKDKEEKNSKERPKSQMRKKDSRTTTPGWTENQRAQSRILLKRDTEQSEKKERIKKSEEMLKKPSIAPSERSRSVKTMSSRRLLASSSVRKKIVVQQNESLGGESKNVRIEKDLFESFDNILNKKTDTRESEENQYIKAVKLIQRNFRRYLTREKARWNRKKVNHAFKKLKIINNEVYLIIIDEHPTEIKITATSKDKKYFLSAPKTDYCDVYKRLDIKSNSLILTEEQTTPITVLKSEVIIKDISYDAEYSMVGKKLIIRVYKADKEYTKEMFIHSEHNKAIPSYLIEKIQPKLNILNNTLTLSEHLASTSSFIYLNNSLVLLSVKQYESCVEYYIDSQLVFSESNFKSLFPCCLYLSAKSQKSVDEPLVFKKRRDEKIKKAYKEKLLLNNGFEYDISVYSVLDRVKWFYFDAYSEDSPSIAGMSYRKLELKNIFGYNVTENNLHEIVKRLILINNVLDLKTTVNEVKVPVMDIDFNIEKTIVKIQSVFRGNRTRDMLKLKKCKNELLMSMSKILENIPVTIKIYKSKKSYLIEIIKQTENKSFYCVVCNPLEYVTMFFRYSHVKLLVQAIKIKDVPYILSISGKKNSFIECEYDKDEISATGAIVDKFEEKIMILGLVLPTKTIIAKIFDYGNKVIFLKKYSLAAIVEIIGKFEPVAFLLTIRVFGNDISHSMNIMIKSRPSNLCIGDQIIFRTCISNIGVLYQVTVHQQGENLKFLYKRGCNVGLSIPFEISLKEAYEASGFTESLIIPMCNYFIKKILVINDDEIVMNNLQSSMNLERIVSKIQAVYRSYRLRKSFKIPDLRFLCKVKLPYRDIIYSVILFDRIESYGLYAVNLSNVYRIFIKKRKIETPDSIIKAYINELFSLIENQKNIPNIVKFADKIKQSLSASNKSSLVLWKGNGFIGNKNVSVSLYSCIHFERVECRYYEIVSYFEIENDYLPRNEKVFDKLELNDRGEVSLYLSQRKTMFYNEKTVSGHECKIYLYNKSQRFYIIVYLIKVRKYFVNQTGKRVDMVSIVSKLKIKKDQKHYSISY